MTRTPMVIFAIHLDMASEMKEPEKPKNAANTSRPPRLLPCTASQASSPSRRATTDSTRTTARVGARKSTMRFMAGEGRAGGAEGGEGREGGGGKTHGRAAV